ncbi:MAG: helical backbone metal receptor [Bdellovibrionota bacterium]
MIVLQQSFHDEELLLNAFPKRIVSLVPSMSESFLHMGGLLVGRTSFCIEPKSMVASIPAVGGTKTPSLSKILALKPDLILANQEENLREHVETLSKDVPVWVSFPQTVSESLAVLHQMKQLVQNRQHAQERIAELEDFLTMRKDHSFRPKVAVAIWKNPWMFAGKDTYISHVVEASGGETVIQERRYPTMDIEDCLSLEPDLVILPSEPYAFGHQDQIELQQVCADRQINVACFCGEDLTWPGLRLANAMRSLQTLFVSCRSSG